MLGTVWRLLSLRFGDRKCAAVKRLLADCELTTEVFACHPGIRAAVEAETDSDIKYDDAMFRMPYRRGGAIELAAVGPELREEAGLNAADASQKDFPFTLCTFGHRDAKGHMGMLATRVLYRAPQGRFEFDRGRDIAVWYVRNDGRKKKKAKKKGKGATLDQLLSTAPPGGQVPLWMIAEHASCSIDFSATSLQVGECLPDAAHLRVAARLFGLQMNLYEYKGAHASQLQCFAK